MLPRKLRGRCAAPPMTDEMTDGLREKLSQVKERAAGLVKEYKANGYIEQFDADELASPELCQPPVQHACPTIQTCYNFSPSKKLYHN